MSAQTLRGSFLATLSALAQAARAVDDFVGDVPFARAALDPVTYELLDLRALLERLIDEAAIPPALHAPILSLAAACRLVLARIDAVLADDGDSPRSGQWAAAKDEVRGLNTGLQMCRRAMRLAREVVKLSISIELMAHANADAMGVRVADIRHDASQILARAYRVRAQVPLPRDDRDTNRSAFGLQRGLHGLTSYVESVCVEETNGDTAFSHKRDAASDYAYAKQDTAQPLPSPLSMRHMTRELGRISTSESNPNSLSSSESRRTSEASVSWFANEGEDPASPRFQRRSVPARRHTNETVESKKDAQHPARRGSNKMTPVPLPPAYSLYPPPPTKPLPAIPTQRLPSRGAATEKPPASPTSRTSRGSKGSVATSSTSGRASSVSSAKGPAAPLNQVTFSPIPVAEEPTAPPPVPTARRTSSSSSDIDIVPWKRLTQSDKDQGVVSYIDVSNTSSILASKHGNNIIRLWDLRTGTLASSIKVSFYVQAQTRSRDYFVRSHAILSETANLVAIATAFGHSIEIWNWAKRKKLQTIDDAYRWASVRGDIYESSWPPLAAYSEDRDSLALFPVARDAKKPFGKPRIINLRQAGLPHIPKYPELAYSATGPLLVAAAGPRPPRPGQPPPDHGALLTAWKVDGDDGDDQPLTSHRPYKYMMPDQHPELANALPLCLATYGSVAVSIWIPATYRAVQGKGRTGGWQLEAVTVTSRHVLVWDFAANMTRTYSIPDVMACVSPDCRFVAYCDPLSGLVVLDASSGRDLWRWPGGGEDGAFGRLGDLGKVSELAFSADGTLFFSGEGDGGIGVYEVREVKQEGR